MWKSDTCWFHRQCLEQKLSHGELSGTLCETNADTGAVQKYIYEQEQYKGSITVTCSGSVPEILLSHLHLLLSLEQPSSPQRWILCVLTSVLKCVDWGSERCRSLSSISGPWGSLYANLGGFQAACPSTGSVANSRGNFAHKYTQHNVFFFFFTQHNLIKVCIIKWS